MSQRAREAQEAHAALKAAARPKVSTAWLPRIDHGPCHPSMTVSIAATCSWASKKSQSGNGRQRRSRGYADDDSGVMQLADS
ncbi:hypothetical protein HaLaN_16026 [Haematococcus lacustris]|uniref:Uncharacterized protein n=1 Tax=Haematococcus lacustris TaxID=44745 RepID=A0A699ZBN5_HAELA|nr:hypothetical protein HaLaN_16026 [Haematococcus lacustris]